VITLKVHKQSYRNPCAQSYYCW